MLLCEAHWIFNRLYLGVRVPRGLSVEAVTLRTPDGRIAREGDDPAGTEAGSDRAARLTQIGRLFSKQHLVLFFSAEFDDLNGDRGPAGFAVTALLDGVARESRVDAHLTDVDSFPALYGLLVEHLAATTGLGALAEALHAASVPQRGEPAAHVDVAYAQDGHFFVHGWLREHALKDVVFACDGVSFVCAGEDCLQHGRPDVRDFLRAQGVTSPNAGIGFSLVIPTIRPTSRLTIFARTGQRFEVIYADTLSSGASRDQILPLMLSARGESGNAPLAAITRMMAPFFPLPRDEPDYEIVTRYVAPGERAPAISIIVPFYKEWRFLFSLLKQIERAPPDWEWVFVCDDPTIYAALHRMLMAQPAAMRARITLVRMATNRGFATANNVGVEVASADLVLLMNSDIWFSSFAPLQLAISLIESGEYDLLGFRLLFEDGTIQHDGMALEPRADFDGLHLALHPGKGLLPAPLAAPTVEDRELVTGALMLLRRALFREIGGFSPRYIGGDFEDADLCLQLHRRGKRVGLVLSGDVYHLERQSIRRDSGNSVGFARTLINCVTFNTTWRARLTGAASGG